MKTKLTSLLLLRGRVVTPAVCAALKHFLKTKWNLCLAAATTLMIAHAHAETSNRAQITSSVIASGGGTSSGGVYSITHTLGETIVGTSSGGNYVLAAGFPAQDVAGQSQGVDLNVTASRSRLIVTENIATTLTLSVSNRGPATASGVQLTVNLQAGLRALAATNGTGGCQITQSNVTCSVATVSSNGGFTVELTLRADFLPESAAEVLDLIDLTTLVSASETDLNSADNSLALPVTVRAQTDWADGRGGFPVTAAENGPYHRYSTNAPVLGRRWDNDGNGVHSLLADWDDTHGGPDDEDGVVFVTPPVPGASATVLVTCANAPGFLDAWSDFNNNTSWAEPGEQIFTSQPVALGTNTLTFTVPATAIPGQITTRWRVSTIGGLSYTNYGGFGEVEDHLVRVLAAPQPRLEHSAGRPRLAFLAETQVNYQIEYTDSLITPNWRSLIRVAGTGDTVVVTDDTTSPMRFYRIRVE